MTDYERGARSIPYELVRLIAWAYDVPLQWLVNGDGEVPCQPESAGKLFMRKALAMDGGTALEREVRFRARVNEAPWSPQRERL
jgi:hypothetical protein